MNPSMRWNIFRLSLLLICGSFVVVLTTQSDQVPFVHFMIHVFGNSGLAATLGHMGLFAVLTGTLYAVMVQRFSPTPALCLAMSAILLLGTATELAQMAVPGRDSSLSDLLANWLGVFVVGFGIALFTPRSLMATTQSA